jgi:gluconolactonase
MILVGGLGAPETPRLLPGGTAWLCVEMADDRGCVTRISLDGATVETVARTGKPNGLTVDRDSVAWVANALPVPAIVRVTPTGKTETWMDAVEGRAMLLPNDLCFGPDGLLYVTDSGMHISDWLVDGDIRPDYVQASFDGRVYELDLAARSGRILVDGIRFANGIAFGPDGHLYVNEMISGDVFRLRFDQGRPTGEREPFGNVMSPGWTGGFRGPDGMGFGADGRLYCTVFGEGAIAVLGPDGAVAERIRTSGRRPTNLAWGPGRDQRIYVTEMELGTIEIHLTTTVGLALHAGGSSQVVERSPAPQ